MSNIPTTVPTGAIRYNTDSNKMECFNGTKWYEISVSSPDLGDSSSPAGTRAIFAGGAPTLSTVDYITIPTAGNAGDWGDLTTARYLHAGCASATRALFGGGYTPYKQDIENLSISSTGIKAHFGNLQANKRNLGAGGNATRGVFVGGLEPGTSYQTDIDYVTFATTSNSKDFGDLTVARLDCETVCNGSRLVTYAGSIPGSGTNTIDYITVSTLGNAQDFGDAPGLQNGRSASGCSTTRGVFMGGRYSPSPTNISDIEYITIATKGNTSKFGDLTAAKRFVAGTSDKIRALCCGGYTSANVDVIEYVTIATDGDGVDFGNLQTSTYSGAAASNAHGGL